jgi:hypothetical protein
MALWSAAVLLVAALALAVALIPIRRKQRETAIAADGARATLELAESAMAEVEKYLAWCAAHPQGSYPVARLTSLPSLTVPGARIHEAMVLGGDGAQRMLIASSSDRPPTGLNFRYSSPRQREGVSQGQGVMLLEGGTRLPGWFFEAPVPAGPGRADPPAIAARVVLVIVEDR